jgi:O-phosphoseryl-tRNA(Cys) synthetase
MLVPEVTEPAPEESELTAHVTATSGLFIPVTEAVNWDELPLDIVWLEGLTVTLVTEATLICL